MKIAVSMALSALATLSVAHGVSARNLISADPYDQRIIAANNCNSQLQESNFSAAILSRCAAVYDATVQFENAQPAITPPQRSVLAIARGLSMMTVAAGYAKLDGNMSARSCQAIGTLARSLNNYDPRAANGMESLFAMLVRTRDVAIPKCRQGGHWRG